MMTQAQIARMQQERIEVAWANARPTLLMLGSAYVKAAQDMGRELTALIEKHRAH